VTTLLTGLGIDERYARDDAAYGRTYFLTDALGSTLALTDTTGAVKQTYAYEPYGEVTATGSSDNPYQYTGRENDGTGLYYYRARYYSPTMKRFISEDPMGLAAGLNEYAYAGNNPKKFRDPFGKDWQSDMTSAFCPDGMCLLPSPPPNPGIDPCGCVLEGAKDIIKDKLELVVVGYGLTDGAYAINPGLGFVAASVYSHYVEDAEVVLTVRTFVITGQCIKNEW
jgi:RHS repeat-associated protein